MRFPRPSRARLRAVFALSALALLSLTLHYALGVGGPGSQGFFDNVVYNGLIATAALLCLWRAATRRQERAAWLLLGIGMLSWLGAELWWTFVFGDVDNPPIPSPADGLYLGFYPCAYAALLLLVRSRTRESRRGSWLDSGIVAAAVGAGASAIVVPPIVGSATGSVAAVATTLAYPVGDILLLSLVVGMFGLSQWRLDRTWLLIGGGLALMAFADSVYLIQVAKETFQLGTPLDALWPAAMLLVALAAWQPTREAAPGDSGGLRVIALPTGATLAALGLITYDHFEQLNAVSLVLTSLALLLATARMAVAFRDNQRMLVHSRQEARVDALTGLRNRRSLMFDLDDQLPKATESRPLALLLFDLDGFKLYNDTYGHPAGDALLTRLGTRLSAAVDGRGRAYRLGGDEFCALVAPGATLDAIGADCVAALAEQGEGFSVSTSYGLALIPDEASSPVEALKLADRRMYAQKGGGRLSAGRQSRDVLLRTLSERQPDLHVHLAGVAELATTVGRELGMATEELDELARAAELHDIGKIAVPDEILEKQGPLDDDEWAFVRRHTIIGERILMAAPALRPVARLVRSSHERWDGDGYPDGMKGAEIPLGSRVVAVCDAFDAMTSDRSYRAARSEEDALEELLACAGAQFDPEVVEAFCRVLSSRPGPRQEADAPAASRHQAL